MQELHRIQKTMYMKATQPKRTGNATRWHFDYDSSDWYREMQRAIQTFDVFEWSGEGYKQDKLEYEDWTHIHENVAVPQPSAKFTNYVEGTKYPSLPLVLPGITTILKHLRADRVPKPWIAGAVLQLTPNTVQARKRFEKDVHDRFVANLPPEALKLMVIATLLDPRFKSFEFPLHGGRQCALQTLRQEFTSKWERARAEQPVAKPAPQKTDDFGALFGCADVASSSSVAASVAHSLSELEEYLEQPPAPNQTDVLSYWREQTQWPSLQRMARQYLCMPATSAGVERLFSRASLTYGDLRTCLSEENLSNILFAAYNYDPSLH